MHYDDVYESAWDAGYEAGLRAALDAVHDIEQTAVRSDLQMQVPAHVDDLRPPDSYT